MIGYATGLLVARRALTLLKLADKYEGVTEPDGTIAETEPLGEGNPRPFKAFLDTGSARTTTGARVFGVMKGASDGGIFIPHNEKRFPGYDIESKELDADTLKNYIFGGHVSDYMENLEEEDDEKWVSYASSRIGAKDSDDDLQVQKSLFEILGRRGQWGGLGRGAFRSQPFVLVGDV